MVEQAIQRHPKGYSVLFFGLDGNNSVKRSRMPPTMAINIFEVAGRASNLCARTLPKLLFRTEDGPLVGVPLCNWDHQRCYTGDFMRSCTRSTGTPSSAPGGRRATVRVLLLSVASRLSSIVKTPPSNVTRQLAKKYNTLIVWELASIIAEVQTVVIGLPTSEEVYDVLEAAMRQPLHDREQIRQTRLPLREGGCWV